ncbi:MAG: F0F1 ATP synthase subunit B [Gemmatimonadaceae bacterium]
MHRILMSSTFLALLALARAVGAQEEGAKPNLLSPNGGLMFWTLLIFIALLVILSRMAFPAIIDAVAERERALQAAIDNAKHDREEAARILEQQRKELDAARLEAQKFIAEGRQAGEKMRTEMLTETRREQQEVLDRARREIGAERDRAIAELRRETVELAVLGASKVIEKNLDDEANRRIVEHFLSTLSPRTAKS